MKRITLFSTLLLIALGLAAPAHAQSGLYFQAYGGYSPLLGTDYFQDGYNDGYHVGAGFGHQYSPSLAISINAEYGAFFQDKEGLLRQNNAPGNAVITSDGDEVAVTTIQLNVEPGKQLTPQLRAYLTASPGVAFFNPPQFQITQGGTVIAEQDGDTETRFVLKGGLGLDYRLFSAGSIFVEGRFAYLFTEQEDGSEDGLEYLPITVGLRFGR